MNKIYILQELYIIEGHYYWFNVAKNSDLEVIKKLKEEFKKKYNSSLYQVCEVVY